MMHAEVAHLGAHHPTKVHNSGLIPPVRRNKLARFSLISSDDGLPAHIHALQEAQTKKKKRKTRKERQKILESRTVTKEPAPENARPRSVDEQVRFYI